MCQRSELVSVQYRNPQQGEGLVGGEGMGGRGVKPNVKLKTKKP